MFHTGWHPMPTEVPWFDIPSPGAENNAGLNLDDINADTVGASVPTADHRAASPRPESVGESHRHPARASHRYRSCRHVWFSTMPGLQEVHQVLRRKSPGVYQEVLPPGAFTADMPHRVLARLRDGVSNDYTTEVHRGLDEPEASIAVTPSSRGVAPGGSHRVRR